MACGQLLQKIQALWLVTSKSHLNLNQTMIVWTNLWYLVRFRSEYHTDPCARLVGARQGVQMLVLLMSFAPIGLSAMWWDCLDVFYFLFGFGLFFSDMKFCFLSYLPFSFWLSRLFCVFRVYANGLCGKLSGLMDWMCQQRNIFNLFVICSDMDYY